MIHLWEIRDSLAFTQSLCENLYDQDLRQRWSIISKGHILHIFHEIWEFLFWPWPFFYEKYQSLSCKKTPVNFKNQFPPSPEWEKYFYFDSKLYHKIMSDYRISLIQVAHDWNTMVVVVTSSRAFLETSNKGSESDLNWCFTETLWMLLFGYEVDIDPMLRSIQMHFLTPITRSI